MITTKGVKHIANLARIELSEQEIKKYQKQLGNVLDYFEKLKEVDTDGVETADGGSRGLFNIWRDDKKELRIIPSTRDYELRDLIEMAPEKEKGMVKVKRVL